MEIAMSNVIRKEYKNMYGEVLQVDYILKYAKNYTEHREDGPAMICYDRSGNITSEIYFRNGWEHRADGPAWIDYDEDGEVCMETYFLFGQEIPKDDFLRPGFVDVFILEHS